VRRGEITLYVEPAVLMQDEELVRMNKGKVGRKFRYGNGFIFASFALKIFLRLGYREIEGLIRDITGSLGIQAVPSFRTIWDRINAMKRDDIAFRINTLKSGEKIEVAIDSTGLKRVNDGEYRSMKYDKRKGWIKMHLSVGMNGAALTEVTTTDKIGDPTVFDRLVRPLEDDISQLDADGAYDSENSFRWGKEKDAVCAIPVRINASRKCGGERRKAVIEQFHLSTGFKSHAHIRYQKDTEKRRRKWQKRWRGRVGYGRRWIVEGAYGKFKGMFGEYVFSKKWQMIQKEIRAKLYVYNRTIEMF
jgi:hypothetical protein